MRRRVLRLRWIGPLAIALAVVTDAQALTIDLGLIAVNVVGPGTVTGALGPAGLNVSESGNYAFNLDFDNTTGTTGSAVNALSFFDIFVELDLDGNITPCGGTATLLAGARFSCSASFTLDAGSHIGAGLLDLTLAENPFLLTDGSMFEAQDASAGGAPTPLKKNSSGLSAGSKVAIIVAVAGGAGVGAALAVSGKEQEVRKVAEPGTLLLLGAGVVGLACRRVRRRSN
jgi:PEP-CTERM motif